MVYIFLIIIAFIRRGWSGYIETQCDVYRNCRAWVPAGAGAAVIAYAVVSSFGYSVCRVQGRSMQPTINPHFGEENRSARHNNRTARSVLENWIRSIGTNDWVLVTSKDKFNVKAGDIVTMYNPVVPADRDIKRVIATGNETVKCSSYKTSLVIVPEGYIWVEGDNSKCSSDSKRYGPIPAALVFGRAVAIIFPPQRWRRLKPSTPNQLNTSNSFNENK